MWLDPLVDFAYTTERSEFHTPIFKKGHTYLDAVDGRLLLVNYHSIDISSQNNGYRSLVFSLGRFAEIRNTASYTLRHA